MIFSLSHNDLDGIGSQWPIREYYGDKYVQYINIPYEKTDKTLDIIKNRLEDGVQNKLFVTDLNFSSDEIDKLIEMSELNVDIVYIDHHEYDEVDLDKLKKSKIDVVHSIDFSATKLCFNLFKTYPSTPQIYNDECFINAIESVDHFDMWRVDDTHWNNGWKMNTLYWDSFPSTGFNVSFMQNYQFTHFHNERFAEIEKNAKDYFNPLVSGGAQKIVNENRVFVYADEYKAYVTRFYDYDYYMIGSSYYNNLSIRVSDNVTDEQAKTLKDAICYYCDKIDDVVSCGGHLRAFGITINDDIETEDADTLINNIYNIFLEVTE